MSRTEGGTLVGALKRLADLRTRAEAQMPPAYRSLVRAVFACPDVDVRSDFAGMTVVSGSGSWGPFTCAADVLLFFEVLARRPTDIGLLSFAADLIVRRRRLLDEARRQEQRMASCGRPFDVGVAQARRDHAVAFARHMETKLWEIVDGDRMP